MSEPSYLLSELLDWATELCTANKNNPQYRRGVVALTAALACGEIDDTERREWIIALAVDPTASTYNHIARQEYSA